MVPQETSFPEFVKGYFKSLGDAATHDYNMFTVIIFAVFACVAFGIARGLASAVGLYIILHITASGINSIAQSLGFIGSNIQQATMPPSHGI